MGSFADFSKREWDFLIVGTGMGGATLGYALAQAGKRVLFCEKGKGQANRDLSLRGDYAEAFFPRMDVPRLHHADYLRRAGRCSDEITDVSGPRPRRFIPFIGSGTGGSTALYGMALERFFPEDFTPRRFYPASAESTLPEAWPITYEDLRPYYTAAEQLFRVRGAADPVRGDSTLVYPFAAAPFSPPNQHLFDFLQKKELHPYHLPKACEAVSGCEGCQGFLCPRDCKNDCSRICLDPAVNACGATVLDECEVLKLEADRHAITGVVCRCRGEEGTLRAGNTVLAAGALETPRLLLESACPAWPNGLANGSGLVGRNLMRHFVDLFALSLPVPTGDHGDSKEIAFNDLYLAQNNKFGTVQSFGALPPVPLLTASMAEDLRHSKWWWLGPGFRLVRPLLGAVIRKTFRGTMVLASIMEDLPYGDNQVFLPKQTSRQAPDRLLLRYRVHDPDKSRIEAFRTRLQEIFRPHPFRLIKQAENNERLAHACGTCRFGLNPQESVLNANNRAHELANLYVVDASFFPSSGGTNPGLTIGANALRVADKLLDKPVSRLAGKN
jgi:choline dehydrogenase-like flavoprotein